MRRTNQVLPAGSRSPRRSRSRVGSSAVTALSLALPLVLAGCEVPDPPPTDGGLEDDGDACGPGVVVISSDFQSTSVAFVRWDGEVVSPHVISSATGEAGLSPSLSGDVVTPTMTSPTASPHEIVLVDRHEASVLTWVDVASGLATRQLSLRTGFDANATDWLAVSASKGYASRYQVNPDPGREPFDAGSDVIVVDPREPAITGRIGFEDLLVGDEAELMPSPSRMVVSGDRLIVLLGMYSRNFQRSGDARVVIVDTSTDTIVATHRLEGLRSCAALALSPTGDRVAVGCSGTWGDDLVPSIDDAGVAVIALDDGAELHRFAAAEILGAPPSFSLAFASEDALLVPTFGRLAFGDDPGQDDGLVLLPLDGAPPHTVLTVGATMIGEVRCAASCGTCLVADAERSVLRRLTVTTDPGSGTGSGTDAGGTVVTPAADVSIDDGIGLPPRYLGALPRAGR